MNMLKELWRAGLWEAEKQTHKWPQWASHGIPDIPLSFSPILSPPLSQPSGSSWPPHILTGLLTSTQDSHSHAHQHTHSHTITDMCETWTRKCEMRHLGNIQAWRREQQSHRQAVREVVFAPQQQHQTAGKDNSPLLRLNGTGRNRGQRSMLWQKIRISKASRVYGRVRIRAGRYGLLLISRYF